MNRLFNSFIISALIVMVSCSSPHDANDNHDHGHEADKQQHSAAPANNNDHDDNEIIVNHETAERFGVATTTMKPRSFGDVIKVSGQILSAPDDASTVVARSAGIVRFLPGIVAGKQVKTGQAIASISAQGIAGGDANEAARLNLEAAKRELDRLTPLRADGIVTTREYNAALQAYETAKAAYSGSRSGSSATAATSGAITGLLVQQGDYVEAGQPIATISRNTRLTLRADMPQRYYHKLPAVSSAMFRTAYGDSTVSIDRLNGRLVSSPSSAATSSPGYIPVYFTFDNDGSAIAGAPAEVYLIATPQPDRLVVPVDAVVEQQGQYFVYVKIDDHGYHKHPVTLGASDGREVVISSGVKPGDEVVTSGAIAVKLAESSGAVPEGHSHTH